MKTFVAAVTLILSVLLKPSAVAAATLVPFDIEIIFDYRKSFQNCYSEGTGAPESCGSLSPVGTRGAGVFRASGVFRTDDFVTFETYNFSQLECDLCLGLNGLDASPSLEVSPDRIYFKNHSFYFLSELTMNVDGSGSYQWDDDIDPSRVIRYKLRNIEVSGVPGWDDGRVGPAPIPLPAALPGLAGAFGLLGLVGAKRRRS